MRIVVQFRHFYAYHEYYFNKGNNMKNKWGLWRLGKRLMTSAIALLLLTEYAIKPVCAVTLTEIQKQKEEAQQEKSNTEKQLSSVQSEIDSMEDEKDAAESEIEEIDAQLVDVLLSIDVLNDDVSNKNTEIDNAQTELEEAEAKEEAQQAAMNKRIKFMYEKGDTSYLTLILESQSLAEAVNKQEYTEKLYAYDRKLLEEYEQTKQDVIEKKEKLETELSELEEIEQDYEEQKTFLQAMIDEKQETLDDFDEKMSAAREKANEYKTQITAQANEIKQIEQVEATAKAAEEAKKKAEEEARKKAEAESAAAASSDSSESSETQSSEPADPGDASLGQQIASYACQFVGNPYVAGGTSLTEGCDCSGFTSSVYAHFGISIPRSSYAQSAAGRAVSYSEIQPGDILYYGGHVGIYIGNNQIVHASTAATGIKISSASYRTAITIRRFV